MLHKRKRHVSSYSRKNTKWSRYLARKSSRLLSSCSEGADSHRKNGKEKSADGRVAAALTLARTGEAPRARALAEELQKSYPTHTMLQLYWLPTINAAIDLTKGNSSQAIVDLGPAVPYELGEAGTFINNVYPAYVRGQAYLLAHDGTAAASEFRKLLDHRGIVENFVTGSLAHLQIGRAYAMQGDNGEAKAAYQEFLQLWKDADSDIPILKQARAEYARLQ